MCRTHRGSVDSALGHGSLLRELTQQPAGLKLPGEQEIVDGAVNVPAVLSAMTSASLKLLRRPVLLFYDVKDMRGKCPPYNYGQARANPAVSS